MRARALSDSKSTLGTSQEVDLTDNPLHKRVSAGQGRGSDACFARERADDAGMHGFAAGRVSDGTRTRDRLDHNQELYQLSYAHRARPM